MSTVTTGDPLATVADLAEHLGLTPEHTRRLVVSRGWPCVWISQRTIRFTPEHVAAIVAECSRGSAPPVAAPAPDVSVGVTAKPFGHRTRRKRAS